MNDERLDIDELVRPPGNPMFDTPVPRAIGQMGAGALTSLATLPQRMMQSSANRVQGEDFDPAPTAEFLLNAGLGATGAGTARLIPKNSAGVFGGRLAATADHAALARAEQMAAQGVSREEIWNSTGWFQRNNGKWSFEIPDRGARFKQYSDATKTRGTWDTTLEHPEFSEAYPQLSNRKVIYDPSLSGGSFHPITKNTRVGTGSGSSNAMDSTVHEIDHAIAEIEGFPPGSNPSKGIPFWNLFPSKQTRAQATQRYHGDEGELFAENAAFRRSFTPEERKVRPPWTTEGQNIPQSPFTSSAKKTEYNFTPVDHNPFAGAK